MGEEAPGRRGGLAPGQKHELASLVSYQPGSVVSHTLVDRKAGTVTLFAFDEGGGLSEHTSAYDALSYILEGDALVTVAGDSIRMGEGDAIILPAGRPHALRAQTRLKMLLVMIRQ